MIRPAAALLAALLGPAAIADPPPGDEVVVEGHRSTTEEERKRAEAFTHTFATFHADDSLSRWEEPICPRASGVPPDQIALVEGWIRDIAMQAGAKVDKGDCRGNFLVLFVKDAPAFIRRARVLNPWTFKGLNGPDVRRLEQGRQAVRWWTVVDRQGSGTGSLIAPVVYNLITASVVVVDIDRTADIRLKALSALAAFAGLTDIRNGAKVTAPSILNLSADPERAGALSSWDRAFLRELYTQPSDRRGGYQRARIVAALMAENSSSETAEDR